MNSESAVPTGSLVIFFEHKEIMLGVCLAEQEGCLLVLCGSGRKLTLGAHRVACCTSEGLAPGDGHDQLVAVMAGHARGQQSLMQQVDACGLWRRLEAGQLYGLADLATRVFGAAAGFDHAGAVLRALMRARLYFKLQGNQFLAQTPAQVEQTREKQALAARQQQELAAGSAWLMAAAGGAREIPEAGRYIDLLKDFVTFGKEAAEYGLASEMMRRAGLASARAGFDLLVRLGVWGEDENVLLRRHGIPTAWPAGIMEEVSALEASCAAADALSAGREDLTGLEACAIDEPFTRDIDDAISFREDGEVLELGVHMADAASAILPGTLLEREAARRAASLYLPEGKVPMLPPALSENLLSLKAGATRAAVTVFIKLSRLGELIDYRWTLSTVRVTRQLSYDEADEEIAQGGGIARLHIWLGRARERRMRAGASGALIPELQVRVDSSKGLLLKVRQRETPGQMLVAECMILANYCAALLCSGRRIPALYRRQAAPACPTAGVADSDLHALLLRGRGFSRVELGTQPGLHSSLGLPCYVTVTSPIRKYSDLVGQRQLVTWLRQGVPLYNARDLKAIASTTRPVLARLAMVEQERKRYWILKSLSCRTGEVMSALVLKRRLRGYVLVLPELLFEFYLKAPGRPLLEPGATVAVLIEDVDPHAGQLRCRLA